jgi:hypothetical protein
MGPDGHFVEILKVPPVLSVQGPLLLASPVLVPFSSFPCPLLTLTLCRLLPCFPAPGTGSTSYFKCVATVNCLMGPLKTLIISPSKLGAKVHKTSG